MAMPLLRFKQDNGSNYPDWNNKKLIKLASIHARIGWQNMRVSEFQDIGDYYVITGTDFKNGKVNFDTCKFVSKERYDQDEHIQVNNGSVLVTKDGTLGKTAYIQELNKPATLNAGVYNIRSLDNHELINKYLFHYLSSPLLKKFAYEKSTNGPIRHLNQEILVNFNVKFPCPEEQQKIADFLSDIDNQIENYQQSLDNLESQKKELLRQVFSQELRFTKNDGSEYPDWETDIIKNLLIVERGGSPRPIDKYITTSEDGLNWIKIGDTSPKENIIRSTKEKIIPEGLKKTRQVFKGDLILSNSMSYGRPYILDIDGCIHDGWLLIRDINNRFNKQFLCYALGSDIVQKQYRSLANGTTVKNLNKDLVNSVELIFPCPEEQQKIADFFTDFDNRIELERQRLQTMQEIKKGLLQQMFC